ncbi:hypothetical protein PJI17_32180, partial [Mycobacterium kansasii]
MTYPSYIVKFHFGIYIPSNPLIRDDKHQLTMEADDGYKFNNAIWAMNHINWVGFQHPTNNSIMENQNLKIGPPQINQ